jgi:hypothetical protein
MDALAAAHDVAVQISLGRDWLARDQPLAPGSQDIDFVQNLRQYPQRDQPVFGQVEKFGSDRTSMGGVTT